MTLIGRWTFAGLGGPWDETENWRELELLDGARLTHRGLKLTKDGWARVRPVVDSELVIKQKTMIAWVIMDDLTDKRPAGAAMSLDSIHDDQFDAITFGTRSEGKWEAGSTMSNRSKYVDRFVADQTTSAADKQKVGELAQTSTAKLTKIAISYGGTDDAEIKIYKDDDLKWTYTQGKLATWQGYNVEVVFGARHSLAQIGGDETRGYLEATIVAAELHDAVLSADEIKQRVHTDPSTFIRRTVSLQATTPGLESYYLSTKDTTADYLINVVDTSALDVKQRATWAIVPGLADPNLVSLQAYYPAGAYLKVAQTGGTSVERPDGTNAFRRAATFKKVDGLAGSEFSFESLEKPGFFLRHASYNFRLNSINDYPLPEQKASPTADEKAAYDKAAQNLATFRNDATFMIVDGFIPDFTTELPLNEDSWYIISNHYFNPHRVLGVTEKGEVGLMEIPESGTMDHLLWRVERPASQNEGDIGLHNWRLFNKKIGDASSVNGDSDKLYTVDGKNNWTGQQWKIRPLPWMGSDYFSLTNEYLESQFKPQRGIGCQITLYHKDIDGKPYGADLDSASAKQRWRFTFMRYQTDKERPAPPERIAELPIRNSKNTPHAEYKARYPKYAGALGMDYVATGAVSDWALMMARTVLTNVLLTLKDRQKIELFKGYRILIVGDLDGDEAWQYPDIRFDKFKEWRGGTNDLVARISEEMMCRVGVLNVPADADPRSYDQTVHEFGHTIDMKLGLKPDLVKFQGRKDDDYDQETFPWWVQSWFNCAQIWEMHGNREAFMVEQPKETALMRTIFLANREWLPYAVYRRYGL